MCKTHLVQMRPRASGTQVPKADEKAGEEAGEEEEDSCWTTTMPTLPLLVLDPSSSSDPLTGGGTHPSIIFVVATLAFTR